MGRQAVVHILIVVAFGILVPWYKGFAILDPRMILAYACLAVLFVAPASAESAAARRQDDARAALGRIAVVVAYGWGMTLLILLTAFVTLNLTNWRGAVITPPVMLCSAAFLFSLTASILVAALSAVLARRFTAASVKTILRLGFLLVLLAFAFSSRFLPEQWQIVMSEHTTRRAITRLAWEGSAVCAIVAVLLLIPLLRKSAGDASRPSPAG
jgi:hypothetical protein